MASVVCDSCRIHIGTSNYVSAAGRTLHPECFRCSNCNIKIVGLRFKSSENGDVICCDCGSPKCHACKQPIEGYQILAEEVPYHPLCFRCSRCQEPIQGQFEIRGPDHFCVKCAGQAQCLPKIRVSQFVSPNWDSADRRATVPPHLRPQSHGPHRGVQVFPVAPLHHAPLYSGPHQGVPLYNGPPQHAPLWLPHQDAPLYHGPHQGAPLYHGPHQGAPLYHGPSSHQEVQQDGLPAHQNAPSLSFQGRPPNYCGYGRPPHLGESPPSNHVRAAPPHPWTPPPHHRGPPLHYGVPSHYGPPPPSFPPNHLPPTCQYNMQAQPQNAHSFGEPAQPHYGSPSGVPPCPAHGQSSGRPYYPGPQPMMRSSRPYGHGTAYTSM